MTLTELLRTLPEYVEIFWLSMGLVTVSAAAVGVTYLVRMVPLTEEQKRIISALEQICGYAERARQIESLEDASDLAKAMAVADLGAVELNAPDAFRSKFRDIKDYIMQFRNPAGRNLNVEELRALADLLVARAREYATQVRRTKARLARVEDHLWNEADSIERDIQDLLKKAGKRPLRR